VNRFSRPLLPTTLLLALAACSEATSVVEVAPVTHDAQEAARFIRFVDAGNGEGHLDTAIVTYGGPQGQRVDLVAAVHVADRIYYEKLQQLFESYDAVLYEMVKPKHAAPTPANTRGGGLLSFFQRKLKSVLDLEFQLDGIHYVQPNFVHADLDAATFAKLSKDRGESVVKLLLEAMVDHQSRQRHSGGDPEATPALGLGQLFAAFMSQDSSRLLKHLLAKQLHHVESALAGLSEGKGSVLLTERNKRCIEVLEERLRKGDRSLAVFYGGAHMPDLERRLLTKLGFKRLAQRWLTAWDIKKQPEQGTVASRPGK